MEPKKKKTHAILFPLQPPKLTCRRRRRRLSDSLVGGGGGGENAETTTTTGGGERKCRHRHKYRLSWPFKAFFPKSCIECVRKLATTMIALHAVFSTGQSIKNDHTGGGGDDETCPFFPLV